MIKKLFLCTILASALLLVVADEQSTTASPIKNGAKEQLLDLGVIAGKTLKNGYEEAKPTLDNLGKTIQNSFEEAKPTLSSIGQTISGWFNRLTNNQNVKKGVDYLKNEYDQKLKPQVDEASKRLKPVIEDAGKRVQPMVEQGRNYINEQVNKAKPHLEKAYDELKKGGEKILSEHEQRQALLKEQRQQTNSD